MGGWFVGWPPGGVVGVPSPSPGGGFCVGSWPGGGLLPGGTADIIKAEAAARRNYSRKKKRQQEVSRCGRGDNEGARKRCGFKQMHAAVKAVVGRGQGA